MTSTRARTERKVLAIAVVAVIVVGGVVAAVLNNGINRVDKQGKGLVKASCVLVRVIEQGAATQRRSADTGTALLEKMARDDPERATRIKARDGALKQERQLNGLAAEMRAGIACPRPRDTT